MLPEEGELVEAICALQDTQRRLLDVVNQLADAVSGIVDRLDELEERIASRRPAMNSN